MAFSAAGHLLFVVDRRSGEPPAARTASQSLFTLLPAGRDPNAIVSTRRSKCSEIVVFLPVPPSGGSWIVIFAGYASRDPFCAPALKTP